MHKLFIEDLGKYAVKREFLDAIAYQMEHAYHLHNKENSEMETALNKRLSELKIEMDRLDGKHYIKEELNKEKYDRMMLKLIGEEKEIYEKLAECSVSISSLSELIVQAG